MPALAESEGNGIFATTRWTLVLASAETQTPGSREALAELCQTYWRPLYCYVRGRGVDLHQAQDQVQGFFLHLLEDRVISRADRRRGRFRTFLLSCLRNYLSHEYRRATAQKRGGGLELIALDSLAVEEYERAAPAVEWEPERAFDAEWALAVISRARSRLREESAARGKAKLFDDLARYLPGENADAPEESWTDAAANLGVAEAALKSAVWRLRERFRECMREEIARTVEEPDEVDGELQYLREVLALALQQRALRSKG